LYSIWFSVMSVVLVCAGLPLGLFAPHLLKHYAGFWSRACYAGLPICGIRYVVTGRENLPQSGPLLIAAQHQSAFETLLWFTLLDDCRYVMKIELFRLPVFGWVAQQFGQIGVERGAGAQTMRGLLRDAKKAWSEGGQVVIFPEGTRATPGQPIQLKVGFTALARMSNMAVVPVSTDSGHCWRRGWLTKRPGIIHVNIHPAIPAGTDREVLVAEVTRLFEASNTPVED
jgi:1-acyl-sn-glycerol-3-phosphate acyltransferase